MAKRLWFFAFLPALFACEGTSASEGAVEPLPSLDQGAADSPYATRQVRERDPWAEDVTRWDEPEAEQDLNPGPETSSVSREAQEDAFFYECEPGEVEPCVTECGTMGTRSCGKRWGPCLPPEEVCDQADDDCDGLIDEGVANPCGGCGVPPVEVCDGSDNDCDGFIDEGVANACGACGVTPDELCNQVDDDCDGLIDEGTTNLCGLCGALPIEQCNGADDDCDGAIDEGTLNACGGCGAPPQEQCNGLDDDCDGAIDEAGNVIVDVNIDGDCVFAACPSLAPYPVGCDIIMQGGDPRGCVASQANLSAVYFQEGDQCSAGHVSGMLICSCVPAEGLNAANCSINKPQAMHVSEPWECP